MNRQTIVQPRIMHTPILARCIGYLLSILLHLAIALLIWMLLHAPKKQKIMHESNNSEQMYTSIHQQQQAPIIFTPFVQPPAQAPEPTLAQHPPIAAHQTKAAYNKSQPSGSAMVSPDSIPDAQHAIQLTPPSPSPTASHQGITSIQQISANPTPIKRHINFADVAKGFLSLAHHTKNPNPLQKSTISHANKIKFERFAQRMLSAIHNAFKLLKQSLMLPYAPSGTTHISVTLALDGMLQQARIIRASNNPYFDQFLVNVVKQGGSMFPPLPSGLEQQTQHMLVIVTTQPTASGGSSLAFSLATENITTP